MRSRSPLGSRYPRNRAFPAARALRSVRSHVAGLEAARQRGAPSTSPAMKVPFLDLREQLRGIDGEIKQAVDDVIESARFIAARRGTTRT